MMIFNTRHLLIDVYLLTCFVFVEPALSEDDCPKSFCRCYITTANCSGHKKNLQYIPKVPLKTKTLIFSGNRLPNITKNTFQNITSLNLTELILGGNHIRYISPDAFELFPGLTFLDLSGNQFNKSILQKSFFGLRHSKLKKLNLIEMALTNLPESMFEYLSNTSLEGIALSNNSLTVLDGKVFKSLPKLTHLGVNSNKIRHTVWKGMEQMQALRMRKNKLTRVPNFCNELNASSMPNLTVLDLGANKIDQISQNQFKANCLPMLRNLSLDEIQITIVPDNVFSDLPHLTRLSLTWLNQNDIMFSKLAFNSSSVKHLYIANHISKFFENHDFANLFRHCPNLRVLDMTKIRLTSTNGSNVRIMLSPLTRLEKLVLQSTSLYYVPSNLFQRMPHLVNLNLQYCLINGWTPDTFSNITSLKILYLSHNRITLINETSFSTTLLQQLSELNLHDNQFACNCDAYWFRQWVKRNHQKLVNFPRGYECKSPLTWQGKSFKEYDPSYRTCHPISPYITLGVGIGTAALFVCIIGVIVYRYRWHLKHYIYLLRVRRGYVKIPDGDDYIYDAFVAYNEDDSVWIISQLIPHIEKQKKFKLCLHDRDFLAGKYVVDNIQENISRSRKVIIVLTNSLARSQWCNFEIRLAQMRHIEQGGSHIVVVMLEDVKSKYMNNSLHLLLKSTTYIPWTNDGVGRDLFWKKLTDAIKH